MKDVKYQRTVRFSSNPKFPWLRYWILSSFSACMADTWAQLRFFYEPSYRSFRSNSNLQFWWISKLKSILLRILWLDLLRICTVAKTSTNYLLSFGIIPVFLFHLITVFTSPRIFIFENRWSLPKQYHLGWASSRHFMLGVIDGILIEK